MPWKPKSPCTYPGCPQLTDGGRCAAHRRQQKREIDERRPSSSLRGYDAKWQRARRFYLAEHPLCILCGRRATVVDHIRPHRGDDELFWNEFNWQSLCKACHDTKTNREDGGFGNKARLGT